MILWEMSLSAKVVIFNIKHLPTFERLHLSRCPESFFVVTMHSTLLKIQARFISSCDLFSNSLFQKKKGEGRGESKVAKTFCMMNEFGTKPPGMAAWTYNNKISPQLLILIPHHGDGQFPASPRICYVASELLYQYTANTPLSFFTTEATATLATWLCCEIVC